MKIGIRSSDKKKESLIIKNLKALCEKFNMQGEIIDTQPAFNTFNNSKMLQKLIETGDNPKTIKMHIAVECGIFQDRMKNLDVAIISPTIIDAHSVNERVDIKSVEYTSNWLKKFLEI